MGDDTILQELFAILEGEGPPTDFHSILVNPTTLRRAIVHIVVLRQEIARAKGLDPSVPCDMSGNRVAAI